MPNSVPEPTSSQPTTSFDLTDLMRPTYLPRIEAWWGAASHRFEKAAFAASEGRLDDEQYYLETAEIHVQTLLHEYGLSSDITV